MPTSSSTGSDRAQVEVLEKPPALTEPAVEEEQSSDNATESTTATTSPATVAPPKMPSAGETPSSVERLDTAIGFGISRTGHTAATSEPSAETTNSGTAASAEGAPQSPSSAEEDPAFQAVVAAAQKLAKRQQRHGRATEKASDASQAAVGPADEKESKAAANQVDAMATAEPAPFSRESFLESLRARITQVMPKTIGAAQEFESSGKANSVKEAATSEVAASKEQAESPITTASAAPLNTGAVEAKPVTELPPTESGPAPAAKTLGVERAAPKPKTDSEVSLAAGQQQLDGQMEEGDVTDEQLAQSNEPQFLTALDAKKESQRFATTSPDQYRQAEQAQLSSAEQQAISTGDAGRLAMHGVRGTEFGNVVKQQATAKSAEESKRAAVSAELSRIYQSTKSQVQSRLTTLDGDVNRIFDSGAAAATAKFSRDVKRKKDAWAQERYGGFFGAAKWVKDKFAGLPDEVNQFYVDGREQYLLDMEVVIGRVADTVESGLAETTKLITDGRKQIQEKVDSLPADLKKYGKEVAGGIQDQFDSLKDSVADHQDQMIDDLATKYADNLKGINDKITAMQEEDKGLVQKAGDLIDGVRKTIAGLKDMLLSVASSAVAIIGQILKDPIGFVGNLVKGIGQGLKNFAGNIGKHLKSGLMGWLFGALASGGVQIPQTFSLKSIFGLAMDVLGMTYNFIRTRAVKIVGEKTVQRLERVSHIFKVLLVDGPIGLWQFIKEKVGNFKDMVMGGIENFVQTRIVQAGIEWILSLLTPASAFIKAAKAIISIIQFFVERAAQLAGLVKAIIGSLAAIATGSVDAVAGAIEGALGKAVPVVIGFLASLLGLGGIGGTIRKIIGRVKKPVTRAIDWVIGKASKVLSRMRGDKPPAKTKATPEETSGEALVQVPFTMGSESHKLTARGSGKGLVITMASAVEMELQGTLSRALDEVNTRGKFPGHTKIKRQLQAARKSADYNDILEEWERRKRPGRLPDFIQSRVLEIVASLHNLGNSGITSLDNMFGQLMRNDGMYGHIPDPSDIDFNKEFTASQRHRILQENESMNSGKIVSDVSGEVLVKGAPNGHPRQPQVDHIFPRSQGGSNSYSNAQVLAGKENRSKSNSIVSPLAYQKQDPQRKKSPSVILRKRGTNKDKG